MEREDIETLDIEDADFLDLGEASDKTETGGIRFAESVSSSGQ
jgi:hypothetical protein